MAGHSKWANIKHRKGAQDAKKGKRFQKLSKEIIIATKQGDSDPEKNPRLRLAIEKAKGQNMPLDNIKRLIEKQNKDTTNYNELTYEGYGAGGVAILVECLTDNINRTAASVKAVFNKTGGNLGTKGSVAYLFKTIGEIVLKKEKDINLDKLMELLIEENLEDIIEEDDLLIIETSPNSLLKIKEILEKNNINSFLSSEITKRAIQKVSLSESEYKKNEKLINLLEENDDVQNVYNNME